MKKLIRLLSSRLFWSALLIVIQFVVLVGGLFVFSNNLYVLWISLALTFLTALFVSTRDESPEYKNAWLLVLLVFPLAGGFLYLIFGNKKIGRKAVRKIILTRDIGRYSDMEEQGEGLAGEESRQMSYIHSVTGFAPLKGTAVRYYPFADEFLCDLVEDIRKAERFIFVEYFILAPGRFWDTVLEELRRKREEGVDVRIIYDDLGSINVLPKNYARILRSMGFKAYTFNPVAVHMNPRLNYRDHRKIFNIDGNVCYSGGLNLADEYINGKIRFGYWKDNAFRLSGSAVWNMTLMFLSVWKELAKESVDYEAYRPSLVEKDDGYVQPFADSPFDDTAAAHNVYLQAITSARSYCWIVTPYLILDSELVTALSIAAHSGVDVRIVCPHIPDKKTVHEVTRSNYQRLVREGVKVYEFTPGFIHSKTLVVDDRIAIVGTANLDFRSLFLHFELSVLFTGGSMVEEVRKDTLYAIARGEEQDLEDLDRISIARRLLRAFLGFFAPAF